MRCRSGMASSAFASAGLVKRGGRLILEIDIGERLSVVVAHDKAGVLFLDSPRWREAERHSPGIAVPGCSTHQEGVPNAAGDMRHPDCDGLTRTSCKTFDICKAREPDINKNLAHSGE